MEPRDHHYFFAHAYMKHLAFDNPELVYSISDRKKGKTVLNNLWYQVPLAFRNKIHGKILLPNGLNFSIHQLGKGQLLVIELPKPQRITEAYFIGVFFQDESLKKIRYFTLEHTVRFPELPTTPPQKYETAILCEWTQTSHINYSIEIKPPNLENFLDKTNILINNRLMHQLEKAY